MGSRLFEYYLVWNNFEVLLFRSEFSFYSEAQCLRHYEKGLAKSLFKFDRSRINQIWTELSLWGLIGRIYPGELVRILCAFGCDLVVEHEKDRQTTTKSFSPVTYLVPITTGEQPHYRHLYCGKLKADMDNQIPLFLEMSDKLVIGSFYTTLIGDVDSQFPLFCSLLETDLCLKHGFIRQSLFEVFNEGLSIVSEDASTCRILARKNYERDIICGNLSEQTLFYVAEEIRITSKIA